MYRSVYHTGGNEEEDAGGTQRRADPQLEDLLQEKRKEGGGTRHYKHLTPAPSTHSEEGAQAYPPVREW